MSGLIREASRIVRGETGGVLNVDGEQLMVVLMLGGECRGRRLELWQPDISHPMGCGAFQIARFLQSIEVERSEIIKSLSRSTSRDVPHLRA